MAVHFTIVQFHTQYDKRCLIFIVGVNLRSADNLSPHMALEVFLFEIELVIT